jgi:hypothetical protein
LKRERYGTELPLDDGGDTFADPVLGRAPLVAHAVRHGSYGGSDEAGRDLGSFGHAF